MTGRWMLTVVLLLTLAPIGARSAFNPEDEDPGQFNRVMDEKQKQEREAQYDRLKREQAQAEATRRAEAEINAAELLQSFQEEASGIDWTRVNRWLINLSIALVIGSLAWFGWKHNMPREQ
jgi:hypothetical protein